jgi:hypothetical protein
MQFEKTAIELILPRVDYQEFVHQTRVDFSEKKLYSNGIQSRNAIFFLHVKEVLGHRNINSTLVYTHLVPIDDEAENYHHATAKDAKEAGELIEQAWQYVLTTPQGIMMFRKAKKRNEE